MKKLFFKVYFYIGVNVIGIPEIHKHTVNFYTNAKSKYHA